MAIGPQGLLALSHCWALHFLVPWEKSESWGNGETPPKDRQGRTRQKRKGKGAGSLNGLLGQIQGPPNLKRKPSPQKPHQPLWLNQATRHSFQPWESDRAL